MKKTISLAALAISASTSSFALIGPPTDNMESRTYCLDVHTTLSGQMMAGVCDQSHNNLRRGVQVGENGCTMHQISLTTHKVVTAPTFPIEIGLCLPPNVVQL